MVLWRVQTGARPYRGSDGWLGGGADLAAAGRGDQSRSDRDVVGVLDFVAGEEPQGALGADAGVVAVEGGVDSDEDERVGAVGVEGCRAVVVVGVDAFEAAADREGRAVGVGRGRGRECGNSGGYRS